MRRAATLMAHYEDVRRVPPGDRRLGVALSRFLVAFLDAIGADDVHVIVPGHQAWPNPIHVRVVRRREGGHALTLQYGPKDRKGDPWTPESLKQVALKGDRGLLDNVVQWGNPFLAGQVRGLVWWGGKGLWDLADGESAGAARLAWEAAHGSTTWGWHFKGRKKGPWYEADGVTPVKGRNLPEARQALTTRVLVEAAIRFKRIETPPQEFLMDVLRNRGKASMTQAIAYHLLEDPMGPGLTKEVASQLTGCTTWKTLESARKGYLRNNPAAPRWPVGRARSAQVDRISPMSTFSHH